jgi:hypothetical protein
MNFDMTGAAWAIARGGATMFRRTALLRSPFVPNFPRICDATVIGRDETIG